MSTTACPTCGGNVDEQSGVCPQCTTYVAGNSASATAVTPPGAPSGPTGAPDISGYRVIGRLGEGGMGAVYLAEETTLGRRVAVKVISTRVAPDSQSKARFLREARMLATIEHPHVVRVYSFGEVEGRPYLAMEYVEGETLTDRIARLGKLPLDDALRITRDIVDALDAAWDSHVIHRDIKPSNILIDRRNRVRVADFGLAKPKDTGGDVELTQSGLMVGTPHYISPEQAQGKTVDFRSDFYSLGIVLFHMLTGQRPFEGSTPVAIVAKHLHEPMPMIRARRGDLPPEVERLILWMTAKEPEARPSSHRELLAAIDALITRTPTVPMPTFSTIAVRPARSRHFVVGLAATLLLAAAIGFVLWRWKSNAPPPAPIAPERGGFLVAVAPFYGPDEDSAKEGRVMAALIERAVAERLHGQNTGVAGIEETKTPVRSHDEARALGRKLNASAVIWGEAFALRTETEIRPYVTVVTQPKAEAAAADSSEDARLLSESRAVSLESISDTGSAPVKLEAEAPNQIELRKTSASGVGDIVVLLAGMHALENGHIEHALEFFRQAPRSAETLRYEVQALLRANRREEARAALEQSIALDPAHGPSHALLGDLHLADQRVAEAIAAYQRANATGKPFTTARGIVFENKLWLRETYLYDGAETDSLYLLAIDPASQRVVARHPLPGPIDSLRIEGDALVIAYDGGRDKHPLAGELRLRNGAMDRPYWPPPNLLWRMRTMRAGRALARNFTHEIDKARMFGEPGGSFRVRPRPEAGVPATLPDLERALREAIDRDPTQPWHLLFLAITLRAQNRMPEANAVIDELAGRDWPGVPYFQFSWMLANLERLRYHEWANRLYPKVNEVRRAHTQPVLFSTLIERLINAPFVRQAAVNRDASRGHFVLTQARSVGGITPEGEDLVAMTWARHFDRTGKPELAAIERHIAREVHTHPFNFLGETARVDYAAAILAGTMLAFFVLLLAVLATAIARAQQQVAPPPMRTVTPWRARFAAMGRFSRAIVVGAVLGGLLIVAVWLLVMDALVPALLVLVAAVVIGMAVRRLRVTPGQVLASTTRKERVALLTGYLLFLAALFGFIERYTVLQTVMATPIGIGDAIGHPRTIQLLEEQQARTGANHASEHLLTIARQYAAGQKPATPLTAQEVFDAIEVPRRTVLREVLLRGDDPISLFLAAWVFGVPLVLLAFFAVRPRVIPREVEGSPSSPITRIAMLFVPGLYDLRRGAAWRALITLLFFSMPLVPLIVQFGSEVPAVGIGTSVSMTNLPTTFPMPEGDHHRTFLFSYPYAPLFLGLMAASLLAGLVLHALRLRAILALETRKRLDVVGVGEEVEQIELRETPPAVQ